jgi:hypothetical protein
VVKIKGLKEMGKRINAIFTGAKAFHKYFKYSKEIKDLGVRRECTKRQHIRYGFGVGYIAMKIKETTNKDISDSMAKLFPLFDALDDAIDSGNMRMKERLDGIAYALCDDVELRTFKFEEALLKLEQTYPRDVFTYLAIECAHSSLALDFLIINKFGMSAYKKAFEFIKEMRLAAFFINTLDDYIDLQEDMKKGAPNMFSTIEPKKRKDVAETILQACLSCCQTSSLKYMLKAIKRLIFVLDSNPNLSNRPRKTKA